LTTQAQPQGGETTRARDAAPASTSTPPADSGSPVTAAAPATAQPVAPTLPRQAGRHAARRAQTAPQTAPATAAPAPIFTAPATHVASVEHSAPAPPQKVPSQWPGIGGLAAFASGAGGGGLVLFALFSALFLLAAPTAVRWLRSALALGMSPAYVAFSERPG
jgi:hypothetical protein